MSQIVRRAPGCGKHIRLIDMSDAWCVSKPNGYKELCAHCQYIEQLEQLLYDIWDYEVMPSPFSWQELEHRLNQVFDEPPGDTHQQQEKEKEQ